jgi:hypothetical protein
MGWGLGGSSEGQVIEKSATIEGDLATARTHSRWFDVVGIAWVIIAACLALVPARIHGSYFGTYDSLSQYGLTAHPGSLLHNAAVPDQADEVVPWITLAWTQVHHGHLPLWNPYEALGMPLAFNWGSGAFSLPALVSYITPLRFIYWVQILVSMVVGGTGAYFFGRVMRLHPVACAFAGTTWVLSGPFFGYLGLPDASVMSWAGWQFAAVVLILRGSHRFASVALLAVTLAFSILAGNPQIEIVIFLALAVFAAVILVLRVVPVGAGGAGGGGPIRRPVVDLIIACVAGGALSAPLALPGLQLASMSVRNASPYANANPISQVLGTVFQSFWGQPLAGSFINAQGFFVEQWVYVGAIAVALAAVGIAVRWRRPEVVALAAATLVAVAASVLQPVDSLLNQLPLIGHSWWSRALIPLAFCLAMLGAVGLDTVLQPSERRRAARWALGAFGTMALALGLIWLFGRGHLLPYEMRVRNQSFVWPVVSTAVGLAAFAVLVVTDHRMKDKDSNWTGLRWLTIAIAGSLLICQTVFLIVDDGPIPSSSSTPYQPTAAVISLQRAVGSSLVGFGVNTTGFGGYELGIAPDANIDFGIYEFGEYDPITPLSFFTVWKRQNRTSPGISGLYDFLPGIPSATVARRYGVSYVLERAGVAGPPGSVFVAHAGNENLFRIPGAATATLVPPSTSGGWPSIDASGKPVPVEHPTPSEVRIVTDSPSSQVLRLRVASFPGWKATIDGRSLPMATYLSMMLQARIPPGKHVIELRYWPTSFTEGLVIAGCAVVAFAAVALVAWRRKVAGGGGSP